MKSKLLSILLGLLSLTLNSCGPVDNSHDNVSEVKYRFLDNYNRPFRGIYSGTKICMEGPYANSWKMNVLQGLKQWVAQIKVMDPEIVETYLFTCNDPDYRITTFGYNGRAHALRNGSIRLFNNSDQATINHEFGHVFAGLHDTYVEGVWACQPGQPISLMCTTRYGSNLFSDDISGVRARFSNHLSLERPKLIFKRTVRRLANEKNCLALNSLAAGNLISSTYLGPNQENMSSVTYSLGNARYHLPAPYLSTVESFYNLHSDAIWRVGQTLCPD